MAYTYVNMHSTKTVSERLVSVFQETERSTLSFQSQQRYILNGLYYRFIPVLLM